MQERTRAIVLQGTMPEQRHTIALIDERIGRMNVLAYNKHLPSGTLIRYSTQQRRYGLPVLEGASIEQMPLHIARDDILFLHHILELCYYFIPLGSCTSGIFDLLQFLYSTECALWNDAVKKFYAFRLLTAIGQYSVQPAIHQEHYHQLCALSVDELAESCLVIEYQQAIEQWLHHCVYEHPYICQFKTAHFLTRN